MQDTEGFFLFVYPAFWPIKNVAEMNKALSACNDINSTIKAVKVFVLNGDVFMVVSKQDVFWYKESIANHNFTRS